MLIILDLILLINLLKNLWSGCQPGAVQAWQIILISCACCSCGCQVGCVEKDCEAKSGFNKNEYKGQFKVSSVKVEERGAQGICHPYELKRALLGVRRRFG